MSDLPRVSLIILNYNGRAVLDRCLQSAVALEYPADRLEILLCDNGSTDGSVDRVTERYPRVRVLQLEKNYGFAEGNNRAVDAARQEWVAFVNNDMWFAPSWLRDFVSAIDEHPEIDCFTCRIMNWNGTAIDFVGGAINFEGHGFQLDHGKTTSPLDRERRVIAPCGGATLIKRERFCAVGGFDPLYFSFFEDTDLGWRLNLLGHDVLYTPRATTFHREHATARKFPAHRLRVLYERNALFTIYKNLEDASLALALPAALLLSNERALLLAKISLGDFQIEADAPAAPAASEPADATPSEPGGSLVEKSRRALREGGWGALAAKGAGYLRAHGLAALRGPALHGGDFLPNISLSHYVAMHQFAERVGELNEKRRSLQAKRVRSDQDLAPLFAEPFRPTWNDPEYVRFHGQLSRAIGIRDRFASR